MMRGQLAKEAGVNIETLRYYERRRLIPDPPRTDSGYRQYTRDDITRIMFIKHAQNIGFTLEEVSELLDLRVDRDTACDEVRIRTEVKIVEIEGKIRALEKMKEVLSTMVVACNENNLTGECPILDALEQPVERGDST